MTKPLVLNILAAAGIAASALAMSAGRYRNPAYARIPPPSSPVDVDFTAFHGIMRDVKFTAFLRAPGDFRGKRVRLCGVALQAEDAKGRRHYGVKVFDAAGCCPLFVVEYVPTGTNAVPEEGAEIVVDGTVHTPGPGAFCPVAVGNAVARPL